MNYRPVLHSQIQEIEKLVAPEFSTGNWVEVESEDVLDQPDTISLSELSRMERAR